MPQNDQTDSKNLAVNAAGVVKVRGRRIHVNNSWVQFFRKALVLEPLLSKVVGAVSRKSVFL